MVYDYYQTILGNVYDLMVNVEKLLIKLIL